MFSVGGECAEKEIKAETIKVCGYIKEKQWYDECIDLLAEKLTRSIGFEKYTRNKKEYRHMEGIADDAPSRQMEPYNPKDTQTFDDVDIFDAWFCCQVWHIGFNVRDLIKERVRLHKIARRRF